MPDAFYHANFSCPFVDKGKTMAQTSGRIACPRCGANNFETVTACWKCGAPLNGAASANSANAASSASSASAASTFAGGYVNAGAERAAGVPNPAVFMTPPVANSGDSGVATRAAIALALTFPWIGLPVGWCFMMIEDRRKAGHRANLRRVEHDWPRHSSGLHSDGDTGGDCHDSK